MSSGSSFNALGGADNITVNDLTGTDVQQVAIDLAAPAGPGRATAIRGQRDRQRHGRQSIRSSLPARPARSSSPVSSAQVSIDDAEQANDSLVVNALGGSDTINASTLPAGAIKLSIDDGAGDDSITGSQSNDVVIGATVTATYRRFARATTCSSGTRATAATSSRSEPAPTRSSSSARTSTRTSTSRPTARACSCPATSAASRWTWPRIESRVGADNITIDAQTGTDLKQFAIDLGAGSDDQADTVKITTNGQFTVTDVNGVVTVSDLTSTVTIANFDEDTDHLVINGQPVT